MERQKAQSSNSPDIPIFFHSLLDRLYRSGLKDEGLFRKNGNRSLLSQLAEQVDKGTFNIESIEDVHTATGLIKLYLNSLPVPLITFELVPLFHAITDQRNDADRKMLAAKGVSLLPQSHIDLLKSVLRLMVEISARAAENMMDSKNLAIVIGPNIIKEEMGDYTRTLRSSLESLKKTSFVLRFLIDHADEIFPDLVFSFEEGTSPPLSPHSQQSPPVSPYTRPKPASSPCIQVSSSSAAPSSVSASPASLMPDLGLPSILSSPTSSSHNYFTNGPISPRLHIPASALSVISGSATVTAANIFARPHTVEGGAHRIPKSDNQLSSPPSTPSPSPSPPSPSPVTSSSSSAATVVVVRQNKAPAVGRAKAIVGASSRGVVVGPDGEKHAITSLFSQYGYDLKMDIHQFNDFYMEFLLSEISENNLLHKGPSVPAPEAGSGGDGGASTQEDEEMGEVIDSAFKLFKDENSTIQLSEFLAWYDEMIKRRRGHVSHHTHAQAHALALQHVQAGGQPTQTGS
eukprot:TRINITY_DN78_c0_g1_i6.p1 TRINITY_DN78_c0_g1~~TRINITY_DN78_c0_g1_i6.p1  ORF type:complete len:516 (-),score=108.72 TRINITY_DN78_c0_g1_i6:1040-2587(-)